MQTNSNNHSSPSTTGSGFSTNSHSAKTNSALTNQDAGYHSRAIRATTSISSSTISNHPTATSPYRLSSSLSKLVGNYSRPHRAMESLVFNPTEQIQQNAYMNHPFQPTYPTNLGILNAERYDDGRSSIGSREPNMMGSTAQMQNPMPFGMLEKTEDGSETRPPSEEPGHGKKRRKRVRDESPGFEDDEEARKKARGRPRVDTKDETAADVSLLLFCNMFQWRNLLGMHMWTSKLKYSPFLFSKLQNECHSYHSANYYEEAKNSNSHGPKGIPPSQRDHHFFFGEASSRASEHK